MEAGAEAMDKYQDLPWAKGEDWAFLDGSWTGRVLYRVVKEQPKPKKPEKLIPTWAVMGYVWGMFLEERAKKLLAAKAAEQAAQAPQGKAPSLRGSAPSQGSAQGGSESTTKKKPTQMNHNRVSTPSCDFIS